MSLIKTNYNSSAKAQKLVEAVGKSRSKLSSKTLKREKYNLIKAISENYKIDDFFQSRIPNYKVYASIYKMFANNSNPIDEVDSNFTIIEHIIGKKIIKEDVQTDAKQEFEKQDKDLRLLSYQLMVDNFNGKYKSLSSEQNHFDYLHGSHRSLQNKGLNSCLCSSSWDKDFCTCYWPI